jgi:hypothetical protein
MKPRSGLGEVDVEDADGELFRPDGCQEAGEEAGEYPDRQEPPCRIPRLATSVQCTSFFVW